jgi:TRAP-type C4-dicarboxylate transport system permease small subunit
VDVWPRLGPRPTAALNLLSGVAVLVFAGVFLWFGVEFTRFGWNRTSELADLPLWMIHVAWPITGLAWIVFLGEQMLDNWRVLVGSRA